MDTIEQDDVTRAIDLRDIDPSPFQHRKIFDSDKLKELAASVQRDGLIAPILVRPIGNRFELIAGERRFRAIRDHTDMQTIQARIVEVDDIGAQRKSATENIQREDLTVFETIEAIVKLVDSELIGDKEYGSMGKNPVDRVKTLLDRLDSVRRSEQGGYKVSDAARETSHKFVGSVQQIFKNLPKPLEWRSFYIHDLPLLLSTCKEVQDASIQHNLNKSQIKSLAKLKKVSENKFKRFANPEPSAPKVESSPDNQRSGDRDLSDFSAAEIDAITGKEIKKQVEAEQGRSREIYPIGSKVKALLMDRLGIPFEIIARVLKISPRTVARYCNNDQLFQSVRKALEDGLAVSEVAKQHAWPESLVWAIALEGKNDLDRFKALIWGLRTWDVWYWNECDKRFGDEWPGRIPAQMIAHILCYFSEQGDPVFDPMAGGGVVADTCLAFNRKCRSFDMDARPDKRPEIESHFWDIDNMKWPLKGEAKPDLIIFDPPYFKKQSGKYDSGGISGLSKEKYMEFLESFLSLAHLNANKRTRMAFINADWRNFQNTPAKNETRENSILINDYLRILNENGWKETHIFQAPLSSERFTANVVSAMQKKKIIGVTSRYVIISEKKAD